MFWLIKFIKCIKNMELPIYNIKPGSTVNKQYLNPWLETSLSRVTGPKSNTDPFY